jgi:hypothetical protein
MPSSSLGVALRVHQIGDKPCAKILMPNGSPHDFLIDDLVLVASSVLAASGSIDSKTKSIEMRINKKTGEIKNVK